jgi:acyl carrier protein
VFEVLKEILIDDFEMRAGDIVPTARRAEVGLDSLAAVELSNVLSSRLGIQIHDYELLALATLGDVARLMDERLITARAGSVEPGR